MLDGRVVNPTLQPFYHRFALYGRPGAENLAPTGLRFPDRSSRSESLYRLRYPGLRESGKKTENINKYIDFLLVTNEEKSGFSPTSYSISHDSTLCYVILDINPWNQRPLILSASRYMESDSLTSAPKLVSSFLFLSY